MTELHNPLAKLPVMLLEDGSSIFDSRYILDYLEWVYPETPLLPSDIADRLLAKKLEVLADGVCDAVVLLFFERMRGASASAEWTARQTHKIEAGVSALARLIGSRKFAVADQFGLGDIAVGSVLGYLKVRFQEFDWQILYPALAQYSAILEQRPSFSTPSLTHKPSLIRWFDAGNPVTEMALGLSDAASQTSKRSATIDSYSGI